MGTLRQAHGVRFASPLDALIRLCFVYRLEVRAGRVSAIQAQQGLSRDILGLSVVLATAARGCTPLPRPRVGVAVFFSVVSKEALLGVPVRLLGLLQAAKGASIGLEPLGLIGRCRPIQEAGSLVVPDHSAVVVDEVRLVMPQEIGVLQQSGRPSPVIIASVVGVKVLVVVVISVTLSGEILAATAPTKVV